MRNSTILFIAAIVILVWFGSEVFTASELCATSCISLAGLNYAEDGLVVAILPVLLLIAGFNTRKKEKAPQASPTSAPKQN